MRKHLNSLFRRFCGSFPRMLCSAAFIIAAACAIGWLVFRDSAPPDVSDLMVACPEERDAVSFDALLTWSALHPLRVSWDAESKAFSQGKSPPTDKVVHGIVGNRDSLQNLESLIGVKGFLSLGPDSAQLADEIQLAGVLLGRSVQLHAHNGDFSKALGDALFLTRLGVALMRSAASGSQWELGAALTGWGLSRCEWLLRNPLCAENDMLCVSRLLDSIKAECPDLGLGNLARHEYWTLDRFIAGLAAGKHGLEHPAVSCVTDSQAALFLGRLMFRPNHARARAAMWQREVIRLSMGNTDVTEEEYAQSDFMSMFSRGGSWGNRASGILLQAVDMQLKIPGFRSPLALQQARNEIVALSDGIRLLVSLGQYEREHGSPPDSLAELCPLYMEVPPPDPFGGKPFRYDKSRRVVYSLGPGLVDRGGLHGSPGANKVRSAPLYGAGNIVFPLLPIKKP